MIGIQLSLFYCVSEVFFQLFDCDTYILPEHTEVRSNFSMQPIYM
jgi:hypothetical protein